LIIYFCDDTDLKNPVGNLNFNTNLILKNDVRLRYSLDTKKKQGIFNIWFHTAFIKNEYLSIEKSKIDYAARNRKKLYSSHFRVELFFQKV